MIIKSMSRKEPTFAQLYDYIVRDDAHDTRFTYTQNFLLRDREAILEEFERNAKLLSKYKSANYLYHEVISISRAEKLDELRQKELLQDIVMQYAKARGEDCLVFGGLHDEKDNNLHYHLIISANKFNEHRRHSLKKVTFDKIKRQTEVYVLERYPELEQQKLISREFKSGDSDTATHSNREQEVKRRTKKPTQKELFRVRLQEIFANSVDKSDFFDKLGEADIEMYVRGKTIGFLDVATGRKHRLKTLGLVEEFEAINHTISQAEKQQSQAGGEQQSAKAERQAKSDSDSADTPKAKSKTKTSEKAQSAKQAKDHNADTNEQINQEIERRQEKMKKYREQSARSQDSDQAKDSDL